MRVFCVQIWDFVGFNHESLLGSSMSLLRRDLDRPNGKYGQFM